MNGYVVYTPSSEEDKVFHNYFLKQAEQTGFGFVGTPYQRGAGLGSIFGSLFRGLAPLAKSALKTVGRAAASTGLQVASDALEGRDLGESLRERGREAGAGLVRKAAKAIEKPKKRKRQRGKGLGIRPNEKTIKETVKRIKISDDIFDD